MRAGRLLTIATAALLLIAPAAHADHHLIKIREVFPGTAAAFDKAFVELRMVAPGQNFVNGRAITIYNSAGTLVNTTVMSGNVPNGQNNRTILLGDIDVTNRDYPANIGTLISPAGGAVCFPDASPPDCVAWGSFSNPGALPGPVGTNVAPGGIPASGTTASALVRDMSAGCPTFLEPLDDTDDSLADFDVVDAETPEANGDPPTTAKCDTKAPRTTITKAPKRRTTKARVTIRFGSDEAGSAFRCRLDDGGFEACASPFKARVGLGKHRFAVFATDAAGNEDPTPAKARFQRIESPR